VRSPGPRTAHSTGKIARHGVLDLHFQFTMSIASPIAMQIRMQIRLQIANRKYSLSRLTVDQQGTPGLQMMAARRSIRSTGDPTTETAPFACEHLKRLGLEGATVSRQHTALPGRSSSDPPIHEWSGYPYKTPASSKSDHIFNLSAKPHTPLLQPYPAIRALGSAYRFKMRLSKWNGHLRHLFSHVRWDPRLGFN